MGKRRSRERLQGGKLDRVAEADLPPPLFRTANHQQMLVKAVRLTRLAAFGL